MTEKLTGMFRHILLLACLCLNWVLSNTQEQSEISERNGHYPHRYCTMTNVILHKGQFVYQAEKETTKCAISREVWNISSSPSLDDYKCDDFYDVGHVFTVFYYYGMSNYYHLHYDMMIPLYQNLHHKTPEKSQNEVLMPSVETRRLKEVNLFTPGFEDENKYWMEMLKVVTKDMKMRPLDGKLMQEDRTLCFKKVNFGIPKSNSDDSEIINGFVKFVRNQLNIIPEPEPLKSKKIGFISRKRRRLILNEEELLRALRKKNLEVDALEFEKMTYKEQVENMLKYSVVVGMNGAGLMNGVYVRNEGTVIQLVPYEAQLNYKTFGNILQARGPYLIWHNMHEENTRSTKNEKYNGQANTIVDVEEFLDLIERALSLHEKTLLLLQREEL